MNKETEGRDTGNSGDVGEHGGGDGSRGNDFILVLIHRDGGELHSPAPETVVQSKEREALHEGQRGINQRHTSRLQNLGDRRSQSSLGG